jgi:hypothetical protein
MSYAYARQTEGAFKISDGAFHCLAIVKIPPNVFGVCGGMITTSLQRNV